MDPRVKQFIIVTSSVFGTLCLCTMVVGTYRLTQPKKKVRPRTHGGIDASHQVVVHDDTSSDDETGDAEPTRQHRRNAPRRAQHTRRHDRRRAQPHDRRELPASARYGVPTVDEQLPGPEEPPSTGRVFVVSEETVPMRQQRRDSIGSATTASTVATTRRVV